MQIIDLFLFCVCPNVVDYVSEQFCKSPVVNFMNVYVIIVLSTCNVWCGNVAMFTIDVQLSGMCNWSSTIAHEACVVTTMWSGNTADAESTCKIIILSDRNIVSPSVADTFVVFKPREGDRKVTGHHHTLDTRTFSYIDVSTKWEWWNLWWNWNVNRVFVILILVTIVWYDVLQNCLKSLKIIYYCTPFS